MHSNRACVIENEKCSSVSSRARGRLFLRRNNALREPSPSPSSAGREIDKIFHQPEYVKRRAEEEGTGDYYRRGKLRTFRKLNRDERFFESTRVFARALQRHLSNRRARVQMRESSERTRGLRCAYNIYAVRIRAPRYGGRHRNKICIHAFSVLSFTRAPRADRYPFFYCKLCCVMRARAHTWGPRWGIFFDCAGTFRLKLCTRANIRTKYICMIWRSTSFLWNLTVIIFHFLAFENFYQHYTRISFLIKLCVAYRISRDIYLLQIQKELRTIMYASVLKSSIEK